MNKTLKSLADLGGAIPATSPPEVGGQVLPIKIGRIRPCPFQPRKFFSDVGLEALADSLMEGQVQPVVVYRVPDEPGAFELVDGERRWRASKIIEKRTGKEPTLNAVIAMIANPREHFRKSVLANLHREDLSPLDEAAAINTLREQGDTIEAIAKLLSKSVTYVDNYLKVHGMPDGAKALMDPKLGKDARLSVTAAIEIARSTRDPALRVEMAKEAVERNLNLIDTRHLIQIRTGASTSRAVFQRSPRDDYRKLTSFLGNSISKSNRLLDTLDFEHVYFNVNDERGSRAIDAARLDKLIHNLTLLKSKVERLP